MAESHGSYFVPTYSKLPLITAFGLFCLGFGTLHILHDNIIGFFSLVLGAIIVAGVLFFWFREVIREAFKGLHDDQMDRSYRWGMVWFIFSEIMFFGIFFFALGYIRLFVLPGIAGEAGTSQSVMTHILLWPNFKAMWPLFTNPNPAAYPGATGVLHTWTIPALNTLILLSSAVTVTWAHWALKRNHRKQLMLGLGVTILLGLCFIGLQAHEYYLAHTTYNLGLDSGIYGSTFFMLTGFHAVHVTIGVIILTVIWLRCAKGHFTPKDHFGFEASAWYWHFVDVVWLCLFVFVYWI